MQESIKTILSGDNIYLKLGTAVAIMLFLLQFVQWEAAYRANLERDLSDLRAQVVLLNETLRNNHLEHWSRTDMRLWVLETRSLNPQWQPAPVVKADPPQKAR